MQSIKILGISSNLKPEGDTSILVNDALEAATLIEGVEIKFISLQQKEIKPCLNCDSCPANKTTYCVLDDDMQEIYKALLWSDGMIMGTPVCSQTLNSRMKILLERCKPLERLGLLRFKIGGAIAVGNDRNIGQEYAIHALHNFFISNMMLTAGGILGGVGVAGVASQKKTIHEDVYFHEGFGRGIYTEESAQLLGKFIATWTKVFKEGSAIINPKILFSDK